MFEPSTNVILDCAKWTGTVYCDGIAYICTVTVPPSRGAEMWEGSISVTKCANGGEVLTKEKINCDRHFLDEDHIRLLIRSKVESLVSGKAATETMNFITWTGIGTDYFPGTDGRIEKGEDRPFKISVNLETSFAAPKLVIYSSKGSVLFEEVVSLDSAESTYSDRIRLAALMVFEDFRNLKK